MTEQAHPDDRKILTPPHSFTPRNLSLAISAVLAAPTGVALAQEQEQEAGADSLSLEEVLVTARKRTESVMDIPESIQAISEQQIMEGGFKNIDDYVRFIPSMSYVSLKPGQAKIVFRGVADDAFTFIAEPTAALYLDEQSLTMNASPDPRMVDIERIEALSGPQGTLYGASSQSGTLRIITNKPDPTAFEAFVDVSLSDGSEGEMSYDLSAMANIPMSDTLALRLVGFSAEDGGFIDNVLGTTPLYGLFDNADAVQEDINDAEHKGGRISARWLANDDWTLTAGVVYQDTFSSGRPEQDPSQARELTTVLFYPDKEYDDIEWTQYALTIEGDLGFADFVSATSYFERDWDYTGDATTYQAYWALFCYVGSEVDYTQYSPYCFMPAGQSHYYNDPRGYIENIQENSKFSQEFRLSSQGDRFDWVAGLFYESSKEHWDYFSYETGYGYNNSQSMQNYLEDRMGTTIPTRLPGNAWWFSTDDTEWSQYAVFGEFTWHITDRWDATFGGRWFTREIDKIYAVELPRYNLSPDRVSSQSTDVDDFVPKLGLAWEMSENWLLYGNYTEGFRPGGTNRNRGLPALPVEYESDKLINYEIGAKGTLWEGRVRTAITYFTMQWEDYQLEVVDPSNLACGSEGAPPEPNCDQPWQKVVANVGNASSDGLELQVDMAATEHLTVGFNATWLDATLDEDVFITVPVEAGSRLPLSPEFKWAAYGQYDWNVNWFGGWIDSSYLRLQWSYTSDILNQIEPLEVPSPQLTMPSYDIGDFSWGFAGDGWNGQLFVSNLNDERAVLFANNGRFDYYWDRGRESMNRPREYGVRFVKYFGEQ